MQTTTIINLKVGQYGCFDPLYGPEQIIYRNVYPLAGFGVECVHLHVIGRASEPTGRFIVRAGSEPVVMFDLDAGSSSLGARSGDATQVAKDSPATGSDRQPV